MPQPSEFRTIKIQVSLFTPGLQFRTVKVLGLLLAQLSDIFDGDPITLPSFSAGSKEGERHRVGMFPEIVPQIILKSSDGKLMLSASLARCDIFREEKAIDDVAGESFIRQAIDIGSRYLTITEARAGRIACVVTRVAPDGAPAKVLAGHFCKDQWLSGALKRPENFELHAHKRFKLGDLFVVNSWMRCKSAALEADQKEPTPCILVEQDLNSLSEELETRELGTGDIDAFLKLAWVELGQILSLYFAGKEERK